MVESKRASVVLTGDVSQAPTIAPSRSSFEKDPASVGEAAGAGRDSSSSSDDERTPADIEQEQQRQQQTENEKSRDGQLARAPTSASHAGGQSIRPTTTREDGSEYPTGARLAIISVALCLSVFLMALDNSIIATAIPKITDQFHSLDDVGWYGSGASSSLCSFGCVCVCVR